MPALLGAVAFMFNDVLIIHIGNLNLIAVAAWLPLILAALLLLPFSLKVRGQDFGKSQAVGSETIGQNLDLELPDLAPKRAALGHSGYREQPRLECPVGKRPQFHWG